MNRTDEKLQTVRCFNSVLMRPGEDVYIGRGITIRYQAQVGRDTVRLAVTHPKQCTVSEGGTRVEHIAQQVAWENRLIAAGLIRERGARR